jgi:SAM-dependent methyltransferase
MPVIVPDLRRLLSERGVELLLRTDLDPRLESLVGDAIGPDSWFDATRQMLSTYGWDAYADLDPEEAPQEGGPTPGAARRCLQKLLALNGPSKARRVLDIGCAAGRTTFELAAAHPDALVLGLDINLALLSLARAAASGEACYPRRRIGLVYDRRRFPTVFDAAPNVDFWACDAAALPFTAYPADLTVALNLIDCVPSPRQAFSELARVTRPGGSMLLSTPYDWSQRVTGVENWLGGHSQRAAHGGNAEAFMDTLLQAHRIRAQHPAWPWHTRLHDRSAVHYQAHLLAIERLAG